MLRRIAKNSGLFAAIAFFCVTLIALMPQPALAYEFENRYGAFDVTNPANTLDPATKTVCSIVTGQSRDDNFKQFGFTKRIVLCIKENILYAVYTFLVPFSDFMADTIAVVATLAVVVWGIQVASGKRGSIGREGIMLGLKIGAVILFTSNFASSAFDPNDDYGGLFGMLLDSMDELLGIMVSYVTLQSSFTATCPAVPLHPVLAIWDTVDCALEALVGGIFSPLSISAGLVGFLLASFVSGTIGMFVAVLGVLLIGILLAMLARAMYILITAYMAFAFMVLISPLIIPLILFAHTKAYFDKWLKLTIGFMLQPIFLFAFMAMLLAAFDTTVTSGPYSVYRALAGQWTDTEEFREIGLGKWLTSFGGAYKELQQGEVAALLKHDNQTKSCGETAYSVEEKGLGKLDSGVLGTVGEELNVATLNWKKNIYRQAFENKNIPIFKVSVPITAVDWPSLVLASNCYDQSAANVNCGEAETALYDDYYFCLDSLGNSICSEERMSRWKRDFENPYMLNLFMSFIMAVITMFVFINMLNFLPYIGSGILGESLSMPVFGAGNLGAPGSKFLGNLKNKLAGNFTGGG